MNTKVGGVILLEVPHVQ